jgi:hypothetical protein
LIDDYTDRTADGFDLRREEPAVRSSRNFAAASDSPMILFVA